MAESFHHTALSASNILHCEQESSSQGLTNFNPPSLGDISSSSVTNKRPVSVEGFVERSGLLELVRGHQCISQWLWIRYQLDSLPT